MTKYHYSFSNNPDIYSLQLTPSVILGILKVILLITSAIFARQIYRIIFNFLVYHNQKFTDDIELIKFIHERRSDFKNAYGFYYQKQDLILDLETTQTKLETKEYQNSIESSLLNKKISQLFNRYTTDWNEQNFDVIAEYTLRPFSLSPKNNFDLVYKCKIQEIKPIKFEIKEELKRFIVQINGEIVNFKLNSQGYVISGEAAPRLFSEYWDVALDANNKAYIVSIYQIRNSDRIYDKENF